MNFDFSEDQKYLAGEARKFLSAQCPTTEVRKVLNDDKIAFHKDLWKKVAEMGWLGAAIPEEHGGLGLGMLEMCVLAEEMGRAIAPVPFASTAYFLTEAVKLARQRQAESRHPAADRRRRRDRRLCRLRRPGQSGRLQYARHV